MAIFKDTATKILINTKISDTEFAQYIPCTTADAVVVTDGDSPVMLDDRITAYENHISSAHAPSNAQKNVQSDWNATSGDAFILNKPTLGSLAAKNTVSKTDLDSTVQASLNKADSAIQSLNGYATESYVDTAESDAVKTAKAYTDSLLAANDAMIFKGTIGTGGTITTLPATHNAGWTYKVVTAGTYAGIKCEVGDLIICIKDGTTSSNSDWTVAQTNIDGAVTGPASSTSGNVAIFDGTTGKIIKDSGKTIPTSLSQLANDAGFITSADIPEGAAASGVTPKMAGTANKGTDNGFARGDHVHPTDTSRAEANHIHGNIANDGTVTSSVVTPANGDAILITDSSASNKVNRGITIGTNTTTYLRNDGTWGTPENTVYTHPTYTVGSTTSTASPAHGETFTAIGDITTNNLGHVTSIETKTVTLPAQYSHPTHTAKSSGLYKITVNNLGHVTAATAVTKADITGLGIPGSDTVYTHPSHTEYASGLYKITTNTLGHVTAATAVTKADITGLGIPGSDTVYTHPSHTAYTSGLYKVTVNALGHITSATKATKADITALGIPDIIVSETQPTSLAVGGFWIEPI